LLLPSPDDDEQEDEQELDPSLRWGDEQPACAGAMSNKKCKNLRERAGQHGETTLRRDGMSGQRGEMAQQCDEMSRQYDEIPQQRDEMPQKHDEMSRPRIVRPRPDGVPACRPKGMPRPHGVMPQPDDEQARGHEGITQQHDVRMYPDGVGPCWHGTTRRQHAPCGMQLAAKGSKSLLLAGNDRKFSQPGLRTSADMARIVLREK